MSFTLTVEQGDHLPAIAEEHGFADWHTIWDAPENADLKRSRDPNMLRPGDQLHIPDKSPKTVSAATGTTHKYTLKGKGTRLCLSLRDLMGQPLKNTQVTVTVGTKAATQMTTDANGGLKIPISATDSDAKVVAAGYEYALKIGHLDPIDDLSGLVARLRNLGYLDDLTGDVEPDGTPTKDALGFAVELFQNDYKLPIDGTNLDGIRQKLKEMYGC